MADQRHKVRGMSTDRGAFRPRSGERGSFIYRLVDWLTAVLLCAAAAALVLFVIYTPVRVKSSSVSNFNAGDLVFASRLGKSIFGYSRGDAVALSTKTNKDRILRVAAFGPERVTVAGGRLYIDGTLLDESAYAEDLPDGLEMEFTVPTGSVLLMPDERKELTADDISALIVPMSDTVGEIRFRAFPITRLGLFF